MSSLFQITSALIRWAIIFGTMGILTHVTIWVGKEAFNSTQKGLVSLTRLNGQLIAPSRIRTPDRVK